MKGGGSHLPCHLLEVRGFSFRFSSHRNWPEFVLFLKWITHNHYFSPAEGFSFGWVKGGSISGGWVHFHIYFYVSWHSWQHSIPGKTQEISFPPGFRISFLTQLFPPISLSLNIFFKNCDIWQLPNLDFWRCCQQMRCIGCVLWNISALSFLFSLFVPIKLGFTK